MRNIALLVVALVVSVAPALAQEPSLQDLATSTKPGALLAVPELKVLTVAETKELEKWIDDARGYLKWQSLWYNKSAYTVFGNIDGDRRDAPSLPVWFEQECAILALYENPPEGIVLKACGLLAEVRKDRTEDPRVREAKQIQLVREEVPNTSFMERLYLDGPWSMANSDSRTVGLVGVHTTQFAIEAGRISMFTLPGFMLVRTPDFLTGRQTMRPAATWGATIRLFDFTIPGHKRKSVANLTVAKIFVYGVAGFSMEQSEDMFGLSINWKAPPK